MSSGPERLPWAERVVRHERTIVATSIALLSALAWAWTLHGAGLSGAPMEDMAAAPAPASPGSAFMILAMWWIMMVAMMLPSAAPAILLFGRVRQQRGHAANIGASWVFLAGYLLAWLCICIAATAAQILGASAGLVDMSSMRATSPALAGTALVAMGLYQLSALKNACLMHCRSPAAFLSRHWRPGSRGALRLGLVHGAYCIGCCWLLMTLLFIVGVMNFLWIAALTALIAVEKLSVRGTTISSFAGLALIAWGFVTLL